MTILFVQCYQFSSLWYLRWQKGWQDFNDLSLISRKKLLSCALEEGELQCYQDQWFKCHWLWEAKLSKSRILLSQSMELANLVVLDLENIVNDSDPYNTMDHDYSLCTMLYQFSSLWYLRWQKGWQDFNDLLLIAPKKTIIVCLGRRRASMLSRPMIQMSLLVRRIRHQTAISYQVRPVRWRQLSTWTSRKKKHDVNDPTRSSR
jgi:hypothetical protein